MTGPDVVRRSMPARIGVVLLNVLTPGLGLFRTLRPTWGLGFLIAPIAACLILLIVFAAAPQISPASFKVIAIVLILLVALLWIGSVALTWRMSRERSPQRPWWSRWYGLAAIWAAGVGASAFIVPVLHGYYKPYYIPSGSMTPTLTVNDRIVVDMRGQAPVRGDVIIIKVGDMDYVSRIAGLAGDTVEVRNGVPWINGSAVAQRRLGTIRVDDGLGGTEIATIVEERFPGGQNTHRILDTGYGEGDDFAEIKVPPGGLFALSDHRDRSADSRFPREQRGIDLAKLSDVRGRVMFISWRPGDGWVGTVVR